jgi:PhnB protein
MKAVHPYLNFSGDTEEAFTFYQSVFGGEFLGVMRFRDFAENPMNVPERDLDKIAHIALPLGRDTLLMGTDTLESLGQTLRVGNNFCIYLEAGSAAEAEGLFSALAAGGHTEMPLQRTEWAELYGVCADRFGVRWMVGFSGDA